MPNKRTAKAFLAEAHPDLSPADRGGVVAAHLLGSDLWLSGKSFVGVVDEIREEAAAIPVPEGDWGDWGILGDSYAAFHARSRASFEGAVENLERIGAEIDAFPGAHGRTQPEELENKISQFAANLRVARVCVDRLREEVALADGFREMDALWKALDIDDAERETREYHAAVGRALRSEKNVRARCVEMLGISDEPLYANVGRYEAGYRDVAEFFAQQDRAARLQERAATRHPVAVTPTECAEPGCTRGRVFFDEDGTGYCKRHGNERGLRPHGKVV